MLNTNLTHIPPANRPGISVHEITLYSSPLILSRVRAIINRIFTPIIKSKQPTVYRYYSRKEQVNKLGQNFYFFAQKNHIDGLTVRHEHSLPGLGVKSKIAIKTKECKIN
jgi:hypothetical protein